MTEPGRPSIYTKELAEEICERLAAGESLRAICKDEGFPAESTVRGWVLDDKEGFSAQYARARDFYLDNMADEIIEISDDGSNDWMERELESGKIIDVLNHEHVTRSRLRVDTRKWYLSKLAPKRYGDKITQEHTGPEGEPLMKHWSQETDEDKRQFAAWIIFKIKEGQAAAERLREKELKEKAE